MKKYILSILLLLNFGVYTLYQYSAGTVVIVNKNSVNTSTPKKVTVAKIAPPVPTVPKPVIIPAPTDVAVTTPAPVSNQAPVPVPVAIPTPVIVPPKNNNKYKDGVYTGASADAYYGNIQVQVTISGGKITDVQFLDYPQDRGRSISINNYADPILAQEAIQTQSAQVNTVSGATDSSGAFRQSMSQALTQALNL